MKGAGLRVFYVSLGFMCEKGCENAKNVHMASCSPRKTQKTCGPLAKSGKYAAAYLIQNNPIACQKGTATSRQTIAMAV